MNETIKKYLSAGISVIPVKTDKRPLGEWKQYQAVLAGAEAETWSMPIAVVCGGVSGGITAIDFDDKGSKFQEWGNRVKMVYPELPDRFYVQKTPSGGWHVVFRSSLKIENRKLACKKGEKGITVLIETRGEGGYFLVAPSEGYVSKKGDITLLETITEEQAEALILIGESLNEYVKEEPVAANIPMVKNGITPFDDYDSKNTPIDLLEKHGWKTVGNHGDKVIFCRPGKERSVSATWNHIPQRFYVFSTSTEFENQHIYKASAVYAILEHRGDYVAAAKQLYKDGYGSRLVQKQVVDYDTTPITTTVKMSSIRDRIYAFYEGNPDRGCKVGIPGFDKLVRFDRGYLNIVTGIPTHGKSEFLDFIVMQLAKIHDWRFVLFSPENYPLEIHFNKLAEKFHEKNMWQTDYDEKEDAIVFMDRHFDFINATEDDLTLDSILNAVLDVKSRGKLDGLVIDPWNELEQAMKPKDMNDSDFTGDCLRKLRKFARKNELCLFVVVHPTKMHKEKDSTNYPVPTLYDCQGSSHWYNKADNGIVVYRNFEPDSTDVYVKKVKFRNYGELGMVSFNFDVKTGCYVEIVKEPPTQF
jgi:KaiC/GvpD/RAD55 family RecA-like ATPase